MKNTSGPDTARKNVLSALLLLTAVLVSFSVAYSCDNSFGVFHEIQIEEKQIGTDLFKNASVKALAVDSANYYAAMAKVLYRAKVAGSAWAVLNFKDASDNVTSDYFVNGMVSDGAGTLYVAASGNGISPALIGIRSTPDQGATWSAALNVASLGSQTVDKLFWAGSTLFAATHEETEDSQTHHLFYSNGTAAFADAGLPDTTLPIIDVVHNGTNFWFLTRSKLFSTAALGTMAEDAGAGTPSSSKTMRGIAVDAFNAVHVTTTDGLLYTNTAGAWGASAATVKADVELGKLVEVPATATTNRLLIAKHNSSYGYFEWDGSTAYIGNDSQALIGETSYSTTMLAKPVLCLLFSAADDTLLAGLSTQGSDSYALYSNSFDGTVWSGWTAE